MEDLTGRQLGPYQITAPLGEGGMAAVYKAYQPSMERYVALKVLPRQWSGDPEFVARFPQEGRGIAGLEHANILPVYACGEAEGYHYLVMRYVEGGTLADLMAGGSLEMRQILDVMRQEGEGLGYAHAQGVLHRDV